MSADPQLRPSRRPKPLTWRYRLVRALLLFFLTPYLTITAIMVAMQRELIYQPTKTERLWARDVTTPEVSVRDVELHAANALTLHGWWFQTTNIDAREKFVVLYFPGNAGCRQDRVADCQELARFGCDVLLFDYRGYGENAGAPTDELLAADARRAWMYATRDLKLQPERIILFGESLGGGVATRLAAEFSKAGTPPAALILNSTFASMPRTVSWHYPAFPFQFLVWDRFPSIDRIPHVTCSVLQFHCTGDETIPYSHAQDLFNAAPAQSATGIEKRFVTTTGGGHNFISVDMMHAELTALFGALDPQRAGKAPTPAAAIDE